MHILATALGSQSIFDAIPKLDTPLQAVVFIAALGVSALSGWRYKRYSATLQRIRDIPEAERARLLQIEMGQPLPPDMTAEQFLLYKRQQNLFVLAFGGLVSLVLVLLFARGMFVVSNTGMIIHNEK